MKHLSSSGAALPLLAPLALIVALLASPTGCGSGGGGGSSATPVPTMGFVQVGFVDSPSSDFQHILLNVVSVRINPSKNTKVSDLDPNWRTIAAPQGAGALGELQIDLNTVQDQVQLFNTVRLPAQEYRQIELRLDPNRPGQIVPNCPKAPAVNEGCLAYPFQLQNPIASLRTTPMGGLQVAHASLAPLVIDFNPGTISPPPSSGGTYTINPTITVAISTNFLGQIAGSVSGIPTGSTAAVRAELSGTMQVIARTGIANDKYSLSLPAADSTGGTSYDVFVSGVGVSFAAVSNVPVFRGGGSITRNFTVSSAATGIITGKITDSSDKPIQGATLSLLIPPATSKADCASTPSECVVVATANTDDLGHYPLPGNLFNPPPFNNVPVGTYTLEVAAAGYDTVLAKAPVIAGKRAVCDPPNFSKSNCSFHLANATISGTVTIDSEPPPGSNVQVLVMAEDTGTNTLENVLMVTIPSGATTVPYTINVPTMKTFDLFASAQDFFNDAPSPFPGHTIEVLHGIAAGSSAGSFLTLSCVGHASLTGSVANPDSGTTVVLSKNDPMGNSVQLMQSPVNRSGGLFSFCAPPDVYTAQRFENGVAVPRPAATVAMAAPMATSTPCPSICTFKGGDCPGVCINTPNVNLP